MTIEEGKSLKNYNTFGIEAFAKYFVEITSTEEFLQLQSEKIYAEHDKFILGGGSNVLLTKNINGLVIKNGIPGIEVGDYSSEHAVVKAGAGVVWHELVLWAIGRNLGGIENLSLIPGLVGAGPIQNIGAYGVEIKDSFEQLEAIHLQTGELIVFKAADCEFGYRDSVFKNKFKNNFLITAVSLRLLKTDAPGVHYRFKTEYGDIKAILAERNIFDLSVKAVSDAVIQIRSSKLPDPKVIGNAGSFFKNPIVNTEKFESLAAIYPDMPSYRQADGNFKIPAGWLIEQCGWKGKIVGNTGSHSKQALVLVNYGNATGKEIWELASQIQQSVREKFGIEILTEVNIV